MLKKVLFVFMVIYANYTFAGDTNKINVKNMWARATIGNSTTGVVYGVLENKTGKDDALVSVSTPYARMSQIHRSSVNSEGVVSMNHMEKIVLKNNTYVKLEPGDIHIMLIGLNKRLLSGYEIPIYLEFENSPSQHAVVKVYPFNTKWKNIK